MEPQPQTTESATPLGIFPDVSNSGFRNLTANIAAKHASGPEPAEAPETRTRRRRRVRDAMGNLVNPGEMADQNKVSAGPVVQQSAVPPIDKQLIEECVKSLLVTIDSTIKQSVREGAFDLTKSAAMADNLAERAALKDTERDTMSKLSALCCEQYQLAGQHAPAIFLGVFVLGYTVRVTFILRALRSIARQVARQKEKSESRPQAN